MTTDEQLEWEARWAKPAAGAAFLGAVLGLASFVYPLAAIDTQEGGTRGLLFLVDREAADFVVIRALQALSAVPLAGALYYLLRAVLARRAEVPKIVSPIVLLGPPLLLLGAAVLVFALIDVSDAFTKSGATTEDRADDLLADVSPLGSLLGLVGTFCVAVSLVLVSLNAMRVGLLSRFLGILGIVVGALVVLLSGAPQLVVQSFWLGALGMLFLGRGPGGRGPAWETGEAVEWPSASRRPEDHSQEMAGALSTSDPRDPEPAGEAGEDEQHPAPRKRKKRKRR